MTEENFHHPALMHGWELVADLKSTQLNIQASQGDIIMVGGHWYLARMTDNPIYAERDFTDVLKATTWDSNTPQYLAGVVAVVSTNLRKIHAVLIRMGNGRIRELKPRKHRHPLEYWELGTMPQVELEDDFDTDEDGSDPPRE
jgi:hypothetical protein